MASRVVLIALLTPVTEALHARALLARIGSAPLLGPRAAAPVAVSYEPSYEPLVADYGTRPSRRQESGGGLTIAMGGLAATLMCSASALSSTGTIATIAASAAGLFSFKVAKELNNRGVDRGSVSKFGTGIIWRVAALVVYTLASIVSFATPYTLASIVSFVAFLLSVLGRGVLRIADGASLFCNALSSTVPDARTLPPQRSTHDYIPPPPEQLAPVPAPPPPPPPAAPSRRAAAAPSVSVNPESNASIGRELAIQQMLQRSASAAANARRIESERSQIMAQKQSEAVAKALSESRLARAQPLGGRGVSPPPLSARPPPPPPSLAPRPKTYALKSGSPPAPSPPARREQAARASQFYSYQPGKAPSAPGTPRPMAAAAPGTPRPGVPPPSSAVAGVSSAFGIPTSNKSPSLASMARRTPFPPVSRPTGSSSRLDVSLAASAKNNAAFAPKPGATNSWLPRTTPPEGAGAGAAASPQAAAAPQVASPPTLAPPAVAPPPPSPPPPAAPPPPPAARLSPPGAGGPTGPPANGAPNPWLPRGYATKAAGEESD